MMQASGASEAHELGTPFLFRPGGTRMVQLQPTLRCNLRCAHCYSESGPDRREGLTVGQMDRFLVDAAALGYGYLGVSGGEPLLWPDLVPFLERAAELGLRTSVSTNATLITDRWAGLLRGRTGLVAVSVDGPPAEHAALRGSARAFDDMRRGVAALREAGVPFSFSFTLTRFNAHRLSWLHAFADQEGALGVNVHPLGGTGAARDHLAGAVPDSREFRAAACLLALLVQHRGGGGPAVTLDVMRRSTLQAGGWPLLGPEGPWDPVAPHRDVVPALVVEPDGAVVPFVYGFPRRWAVGTLAGGSLDEALWGWRDRNGGEVSALVHRTLAGLQAADAEFVDLFGELLEEARSQVRPTG